MASDVKYIIYNLHWTTSLRLDGLCRGLRWLASEPLEDRPAFTATHSIDWDLIRSITFSQADLDACPRLPPLVING